MSCLKRDMFDIKSVNKLTQGSIFNYAYEEDYIDMEILGTVISARCDIANEKVDHYCFLPTIPIKKWIQKEIKKALEREFKKTIEGQINQSLKTYGVSEKSVHIYGAKKTLEVLLKEIKKDKDRDRVIGAFKKYELLTEESNINEIEDIFRIEIREILKKIIDNKNSDYFFIDDVDGYGACIIKLRCVRNLDRKVAEKIHGGIEIAKISENNRWLYSSVNTLDSSAISSVVGAIKSPYIELILQRFSENFTRIGIQNPNHEILEFSLARNP